jgi:hypothetical protein
LHNFPKGEPMNQVRLVLSCFLMLFLFVSLQSVVYGEQPQNPQNKDIPKLVKSSGCLEPGLEIDCLVLKGFKDNKVYSLFFASNKKPTIGTAISFEGIVHTADTYCIQGKPVDVTKWTLLKMPCPTQPSIDTE